MQTLFSDWLKRMVSKSATTPEARIVNLFGILQDWLEAPGMREQLLVAGLDADGHRAIHAFLLALTAEAKLDESEKLAFQLSFILLGAITEEIRSPGNRAMAQAGEAAAKLIAAARPPRAGRPRAMAAASVAVLALTSGALLLPASTPGPLAPAEKNRAVLQARTPALPSSRPDRLAAIYQMHDLIRTGQCSYPQALMLAAEQRAAFLEGVVNIDTLNTATSNLDEISRLYHTVKCSYAPAAMQL